MILKEKCPSCDINLEMKRACCSDRDKGFLIVKKCPDCGYSANWDPKELFEKGK